MVFETPGFLPWQPGASPGADGERLFRWIFGSPRLKSAWDEAHGVSVQRRIRLNIDADAPELHVIPWELLREPCEGTSPSDLAATDTTPFSRYLSLPTRPSQPVEDGLLRVLVAIANLQTW